MLARAVPEQYWKWAQSSRCLCCISTAAHQSFLGHQQKKPGSIKRMAAGHVEFPYVSPAPHAILQAHPHSWKSQTASSSWLKSHLGCCGLSAWMLSWPSWQRNGRELCAFKARFDLRSISAEDSQDGCPWYLLTWWMPLVSPHSTFQPPSPLSPNLGLPVGPGRLPGPSDKAPVTEVGHAGKQMLWVLFLHRFLQMEPWIERLTSPGNGHACRIRLLGISLSFCAWFTNGVKMV